jgi:hypothetical protein
LSWRDGVLPLKPSQITCKNVIAAPLSAARHDRDEKELALCNRAAEKPKILFRRSKMEFDFGGAFFFVQIINLLILFGWLIVAFFALFRLRDLKMPSTAKALWTLIILLIPLVGALAFFLVRPGEETLG